jgi:hypothetical protein
MIDASRGTIVVAEESQVNDPAWFTPDRMANFHAQIDGPLSTLIVFMNSAIAQQALLGGDLLLPRFAAELPANKMLDSWVVSNQTFIRNLALLLVERRIRAGGASAFAYDVAWNAKATCPPGSPPGEACFDPTLLAQVLSAPDAHLPDLPLRRRNMVTRGVLQTAPSCGGAVVPEGGWYAELAPNLCAALPTGSEVVSDRLALTSECVDLLRAREDVLDLTASMRFRNGLTDSAASLSVLLTLTPLAY